MLKSRAMFRMTAVLRTEIDLYLLALVHAAICCISLVLVANRFPGFDINYDPDVRVDAISGVLFAVILVSPFFAFARFSFGYFVGFYLYTAVIGFVWISYFSAFPYDQAAARFSVVASIIAFLIPAMLVGPGRSIWRGLPVLLFDRMMVALLVLSVGTLGVAMFYDFRIVGISEASSTRASLAMPRALNYLIGNIVGAVLPFLTACYYYRRRLLMTGITLGLITMFYAVTLSKLVLIVPLLLAFLALLERVAEARVAVIASLLLPALVGILLWISVGEGALYLFGF